MARGTTQTITVETDPPGATIRHSQSGEIWTSPAELQLRRNRRHLLEASLRGYTTQQIYVRSEASVKWWVIDAFTLGIGNLIDFLAGGLFDLKPSHVRVVFEPVEEAAPN